MDKNFEKTIQDIELEFLHSVEEFIYRNRVIVRPIVLRNDELGH